jgi:hypothetical protein
MAEAAHVGLKNGGPQTAEFYKSKIATADFYYKSGLRRRHHLVARAASPPGSAGYAIPAVAHPSSAALPLLRRGRAVAMAGWLSSASVGVVCATLRARLLPRTLVHAKTMTTPTSNLMNTNVRVCCARSARRAACLSLRVVVACSAPVLDGMRWIGAALARGVHELAGIVRTVTSELRRQPSSKKAAIIHAAASACSCVASSSPEHLGG